MGILTVFFMSCIDINPSWFACFVGVVARYWRQVGIGLCTFFLLLLNQYSYKTYLCYKTWADLDLLVLPDKKHGEDSLHMLSATLEHRVKLGIF